MRFMPAREDTRISHRKANCRSNCCAFWRSRYEHVSYERILSGPGLVNVYEFLREKGCGDEPAGFAGQLAKGDPAAAISRAALNGTNPLAEQALDLWISVYGAEAGNLALKAMATGGIFLGGGISPKILPKLTGRSLCVRF